MREILFRGKRDKKYCKAQDWTEGVPFVDHEGDCIMASDCSKLVVYPETVGQYSGKEDRNGVKMFEGDIVKSWFTGEKYYEVVFRDGAFGLRWVHNGYERFSAFTSFVDRVEFEVVGNIHDNPELLKGGAE